MRFPDDTPSIEEPRFAELVRAGDRNALKTVVETYLGQVYRAARGAGLDSQGAEEVTQATFATFIEKAGQFEGRSQVRTWLFGILYKKVAEARRALRRQMEFDELDETTERRFHPNGSWSRPPLPVDMDLYRAEAGKHINDCLDLTPTQQKTAFLLREVEGLPTEDICKILEVSRTNLGVLLYRARNRLRECLEAKGVQNAEL